MTVHVFQSGGGSALVVHRSLVSSVSEEATTLSAFASDLALPPGEWPERISVVEDERECIEFAQARDIVHQGEFGGMVYTEAQGRYLLMVFND